MLEEIWSAYLAGLSEAWPQMLAAAAVGVLAIAIAPRAARAAGPWLGLGVAIAVGTSLAVARASVFDDAFISFRYVENFLHGHGLVWNLGEHVEGYTNFLWVMVVAAASALSTLQPAEAGLWASLALFPINLFVAYRLERTLAYASSGSDAQAALFIPVATLLLALQDSFLTAGTSGLETGFAALLVSLGVLRLVNARSVIDWAVTGLLFIFAALTRPDHAIFYAVAAAWLAWEQAVTLAKLGRDAWAPAAQRVLAFAAPFLLYAAHTAWRYAFYGELLPNTYYVKAADGSYFEQGAAYAATFYLGSHLWLLVPVVASYVLWPARSTEERRFKRFVGLAMIIYNGYVLKVGGDFMYGRFYVVLLPLVLVALARATLLTVQASHARPWRGYALGGLVAASAGGVTMIDPGQIRWGICDERTMYVVQAWHPLTIDHSNFRVGQTLRSWRDAGLHMRVSTSGIGMVGYYSRMELIDLMGLTDAHVAHQPLRHRGRPGHEKLADREYLEHRMPHLVRAVFHPKRHEALALFKFGNAIARRPWYVFLYDREVMATIKELTPSVRFTRFDSYLARYIKLELPNRNDRERAEDDRFFRRFYFDHNQDPELWARWTAALEQTRGR